MSAHDPAMLLDDMLASLIAIQRYMAGVDEAVFQANPMLQDAVIRRLEILGEPSRYAQPADPWLFCRGHRCGMEHNSDRSPIA
jgi:uncharacterized protein with HEPN domain